MYNELLLNYSTTKDFRTVPVRYPQLTVRGIPRVNPDGTPATGTANFVIGTEASSQGNSLDQRTFELTDNFTIPVGERTRSRSARRTCSTSSINLFAQNSLGQLDASPILDALRTAYADQLLVSAPAADRPVQRASRRSTRTRTALYAQDDWT